MSVRALMLSTALLAASAIPATSQVLVPAERSAPATQVVDPAQFAALAAASNQFELQSSQLALERSQNPQVRGLAERIIVDHTAAANQLLQAAEQDGVALPNSMDTRHHEMLLQLNELQGEAFTEAYLQAQVRAHRNAIDLFNAYASSDRPGALSAAAADLLPVLEEHLEMAVAQADARGLAADPSQNAAVPVQPAANGFLVRQSTNQLMGSHLMEAPVVGANGENIGPVEDIVLDADGRVIGVVVNVGGFLGIGTRNVAIDVNELSIVTAAADDSGLTTTTPTPRPPGVTGATRTVAPGDAAYPPGAPPVSAIGWGAGWGELGQIHSIVVDFTREQIEDAPEFVELNEERPRLD